MYGPNLTLVPVLGITTLRQSVDSARQVVGRRPRTTQWLGLHVPCRRPTRPTSSRMPAHGSADVVRYSFIVVDLHHLLLAGLPAHLIESQGRSKLFLDCPLPAAGFGLLTVTPVNWYHHRCQQRGCIAFVAYSASAVFCSRHTNALAPSTGLSPPLRA